MGLIDIILQSGILPYVVATVISGILLLMIGSWFKGAEKKEKRSVWIKFLKSDRMVTKCIRTFEEIVKLGGKREIKSLVIGMFSGFILQFILLVVLFIFLGNKPFTIALSSGLISFVLFLLNFIIAKYVSQIEKEDALLNKSKLVLYYSMILNWFYYIFAGITLSLFYNIYIIQNQISGTIFIIFGLSLFLIIVSFYVLNIIIRRKLFDSLKSKLNTEYGKNFPNIQITTKAGNINGKIQDVFNEDIIVLDDNGLKSVVEWNEITTLKLQDKSIQQDLSYFK